MRKLKDYWLKAIQEGFSKFPPEDQLLFMMLRSERSNLLDILVIDDPYPGHIPAWCKTLEKYDVKKVLIDSQRTEKNTQLVVDAFKKEGFVEKNRYKIPMGSGTYPIKAIIMEKE